MNLDRRWLLKSAAAATAAVAAAPLLPSPASAARATATAAPGVSLLDLFSSSDFNDEALFALGAASSHTAEVGEVLRIANLINDRTGNPAEPGTSAFDAYYQEFGRYGARLAASAAAAADRHPLTAQHQYLRSAMYAAQQLFFVLGTRDGSREARIFDIAQSRWMKAMHLLDPAIIASEVPSDFGPLPVYLLRTNVGSGPRPTVIISEGSDGQNVETMQFGVTAGLARGYNVVLFEGPGQMTPLFKRRVPFSADWDKVVAPVLEWTRQQSDIGKVALIGISFGGMLCARAAARVDGLDAVVLEPGAHDFTTIWTDQENMALVKETVNAKPAEKEGARRGLNEGFKEAWPSIPRPEQFSIYKRGSIFDRKVQREARAGRAPSDYYGLLEKLLPFRFGADFRQIRIPTLITANEGDEFFGKQPDQAFELLTSVPRSQKALVHLTAQLGASLHDQPTGPQVAEEIVFDWLDDQLG